MYTILAVLPILITIVLMLSGEMKASKVMGISFSVALILSIFIWKVILNNNMYKVINKKSSFFLLFILWGKV